MKGRVLALILALAVLVIIPLPAATTLMPLDEVRPGMVGTGVTVFEGARRDEFRVHILGVLRNVVGPRRSLILARLEGGPLAQTGIIQGMSGSPVYIEGRLVGAVSYALGTFSKEAVAGITPIQEMTEAVASPGSRPAATHRARFAWPVSRETFAAAIRESLAGVGPFADSPGDVSAIGLSGAAAGQVGVMLRPIATPLVVAGISPDVVDLLSGVFRDQGFAPVVGGTGGTSSEPEEALQAGDPIGISLVSGDLELAGIGTVTMIDGDRVYAFGHRFLNLGPTQFPMRRAHIHALLPSLSSSAKIASVGRIIGTFLQDRATAVAGTLGAGPRLIPIDVTLDATDRHHNRRFSFQVASDQFLTPMLAYVSILSTLRSYERESGAATLTVRGKAAVKGHQDVAFEDIFTGDSPSVGAATYVAAPITFLLANDFEPIEIERVEISIASAEQRRIATLERVWLDEVRPRAGQTVPLKILTRTYRGDEATRTVPIDIPPNAAGTLSILVADGARLTQWEQRELQQALQPQSVAQMIRALNSARKNSHLYIRLLNAEAGAVVKGELLSSLPPSVLAVFEADRNGGNFTPLRNATIGEWEIATEHAVRGSRLLTINVEPR